MPTSLNPQRKKGKEDIKHGMITGKSHPAWGAWIEATLRLDFVLQEASRTLHVVRGL